MNESQNRREDQRLAEERADENSRLAEEREERRERREMEDAKSERSVVRLKRDDGEK